MLFRPHPQPLSHAVGEGDYGVRKQSFRPMLKLALQHSPNTARGSPRSHNMGEGDYGVRKRSFRPMLKLALQHSKNTARGSTSPTLWERGWG